ncbi:MAG: M20/M25/M40 family metallo-hydrolase [Lysobacteraceae bacterium]|nr:MAG: M20/M25/M40 family metallo-hydrolase [Xanthomonadaceae bacterium]
MKRYLLLAALAVSAPAFAQSQERVDMDMVAKIRQEAFQRSEVMKTLNHLTDVIGPRLTASPSMFRANDWTKQKFNEWGLANVHDDAVQDIGRGWEFSESKVEMIVPRAMPLHALPKAWTPGTNGVQEGEAVYAKLESQADLDKWKGKLAGKIVFTDELRAYKPGETPDWKRHTHDTLEDLVSFPVPTDASKPGEDRAAMMARFKTRTEFVPALNKFLAEEGVKATVGISSWDNGIVRVMGGGSRKAGEAVGVPAFVMMAEHYNTVMRALNRKEPVRLRVATDSRFTSEQNLTGYNTIAEIPGTGPKRNEVVMIGAHMDSWHAGSGANDNGAGVAVMMEVMRVLKAVGAKPNRTIRVGLWTGEEQGLIGSNDYVKRNFGSFPEPTDPAEKAIPASFRESRGALQRKLAYENLSVYFNLDNGSGKIRGVYAQENMAASPIFEAWLKPFNDVGATIVTQRNTGSTDHIAFDGIGLPGFQFVQESLDYFSNVHHTHLDVQDHASAEDLKQASAVIASFVYHAAQREQRFPRKRLVEK